MTTSFPTGLDTLTNPAPTDPRTSPSHADQHADANDAIEALEAKVGVNGSAVATSQDYLLGRTMKLLAQQATDVNESAGSIIDAGSLVLSMGASQIWQVYVCMVFQGANIGLLYAFPAGKLQLAQRYQDGSGIIAQRTMLDTSSPVANVVCFGNCVITVEGFVTSGSAGDFKPRFFRTPSGTATLKANSTLWGMRLA